MPRAVLIERGTEDRVVAIPRGLCEPAGSAGIRPPALLAFGDGLYRLTARRSAGGYAIYQRLAS